jgi:hypothetical protein
VEADTTGPVAQCRPIELDALASIDIGLPVERQMITELGDDDLRDQRPGRQPAGHHMLGRRRFMAERSNQAIKAVAGRTCFVTEMHAIKPVGDPRYDATHVGCRSVDLAEKANLSLPACLRNRDGVSQLGYSATEYRIFLASRLTPLAVSRR